MLTSTKRRVQSLSQWESQHIPSPNKAQKVGALQFLIFFPFSSRLFKSLLPKLSKFTKAFPGASILVTHKDKGKHKVEAKLVLSPQHCLALVLHYQEFVASSRKDTSHKGKEKSQRRIKVYQPKYPLPKARQHQPRQVLVPKHYQTP